MNQRVLKINKYNAFLSLIIIFNLNAFYLIGDQIPVNDICVVLEVVFFLYVYNKVGRKCNKSQYRYFFIAPIFLVLSSSYMAYISYGQPIFLGIRAQRHWIIAMLMYFPITWLIKTKKLTLKSIYKILDNLGLIYIILIFIQYFIGDRFELMHVQSNMRYGSIRLYVSTYFLLMIYFIHLRNIFLKSKYQFKDFFYVFTILLIHLFVTKSRMSLATLVLITIILIMIQRLTTKKLLALFAILICGYLFLTSSIGIQIINAILTIGQDAGVAIRDTGRIFYLENIFTNPLTLLFGKGFANLDWPQTVVATKYNLGIYFNDNGIFGLLFYYGFAFVIWMALSNIIFLRDSWKNNKSWMFFYLFTGLIGIYTLLPYCYAYDISFALTCACIQPNNNNKQKLFSK